MGDDLRRVLYSQDEAIKGLPYNEQPHSLVQLDLAKQVADLVSEACMIVHDPKHVFAGDPTAPPLSDAVVDETMRGLQVQLDREGKSRTAAGQFCTTHRLHHSHWYNLAEQLPRPRQRALAERLWVLYAAWRADGNAMPVYREGDAMPPAAPTPHWGSYGG